MTDPSFVRPQLVHRVPLKEVGAHPDGPVIVCVGDRGEAAGLDKVAIDRIVWVEIPLRLARHPWPPGAPLDVVIEDPAREAAGLYYLTQVRYERPVRVTIPGRPGIARAAHIAMALQLPVRLMTFQPSPGVLGELDESLEIYLHDPQTSAPVEFFQAALAWWLHGDAPPPSVVLELDPDWYRRFPVGGERAGYESLPQEPGFVKRRLEYLVREGLECESCRFCEWCQGFFKWPDSAYRCDGVKRLLARIEESAAQIALDLKEAGDVQG